MIIGNPRALAESLKEAEDSYRIVYRPVMISDEDTSIDWFVKLCYLKSDCLMVIDEAHFFCSPHRIPESLSYAVRSGRHRHLSIFYITQSWSAVSRVITSNSNEFVFFRIIEPLDLQGIRERCGEITMRQVSGLKQYEHLRWKGNQDGTDSMPILQNDLQHE